MQQSTDISEKVFSELKVILKSLSESPDAEAFLEKKEELKRLQDLSAYLKVHQAFKTEKFLPQDQFLSPPEKWQTAADVEKNPAEDHASSLNEEIFQEQPEPENAASTPSDDLSMIFQTKEQYLTTEEMPSDIKTEDDSVTEIFGADEKAPLEIQVDLDDAHTEEESFEKEEHSATEVISEIIKEKAGTEPADAEENIAVNTIISLDEVALMEKKHEAERKFRLSNIKGVKKSEASGEDHAFENNPGQKESTDKPEPVKSNVSLDFMDAEKKLPVFKLDLNDRIAFTKKLFSGSQSDLNFAVGKLNSFTTLEEAKEYLSEIYYEKNWAKEDEFAQRLWALVESKF